MDRMQSLTLSLTELDRAGNISAQLCRNADSSSGPLLLEVLASLSRIQTQLAGLLILEHETCKDGSANDATSE